MAASIILEPVLHCDGTDASEVKNLGSKLINVGVYAHAVDFPGNPIVEADFSVKVVALGNLISTAKGNTDIIDARDAKRDEVFTDIKAILMFAKPICIGNILLINLSGFDSSVEPSAHPVPPKPVIKKIVKSNEAHSVKVMLSAFSGEDLFKSERRTYLVYVFADDTTEEYIVGCVETNSRKLIVKNVPFLTSKHYGVIAKNSAGPSIISARMKFTLTDN